jgi:hypothetical protein
MTNRHISVFFGHQFSSPSRSLTPIRNVVNSAVKAAAKDWNGRERSQVTAEVKPLDLASGDIVFDKILRAIDESDICIFDLTEKNHNVIFELGHANGRQKEIIWICNELLPLEKLPSDFQGKFVLRYEDPKDLEAKLEEEILIKIFSIVKGVTEERTFKEIWDFGEADSVDLVFGRIPSGDRSKFTKISDPNFLRYQAIADIDTLVYLSRFLSRNFPGKVQHDYMPNEFQKDVDNPLIAVGGPAWNTIAGRYYDDIQDGSSRAKIPVSFVSDESTGEEYIKLRAKDGSITEHRAEAASKGITYDVGLFARFLYKFDVPVFIISGIRTGGVLGAAQAFSDNAYGRRNCQYLGTIDHDLSEFIVVLRVLCRVQDGDMVVETPTLDSDSIILLDSLT